MSAFIDEAMKVYDTAKELLQITPDMPVDGYEIQEKLNTMSTDAIGHALVWLKKHHYIETNNEGAVTQVNPLV